MNSYAQIPYFLYRKIKYSYFKDTSPIVASIKVTQLCNLRCRHCTWVNKITTDLSLDQWKRIIDEIYNRGCFVVFIEGGEPTLRKDLPEIIEYIKKKGMVCVLFTNGTGKLDGLEPDAFWISIDGTEKSHDSIRGNGVYNKIMNTLNTYPDKKIFSITTLSKVNAPDIESICQELSATSLKGMIFNFMYPYGDVGNVSLLKDERINCAMQLLDLKQKYPKIISSDSYFKTVGQPDKICHPWLLLLVTADGTITHGCTVEPMEKRNCEECDMMCGLEATLGFELKRDSVHFWNLFNIFNQIDIDLFPDWTLNLLNKR
ncbi:radical SAM protein [Candidatus Poribacteria bacterium]|nr:radical SAM protein [Candidatus Poribacteria bacterium]